MSNRVMWRESGRDGGGEPKRDQASGCGGSGGGGGHGSGATRSTLRRYGGKPMQPQHAPEPRKRKPADELHKTADTDGVVARSQAVSTEMLLDMRALAITERHVLSQSNPYSKHPLPTTRPLTRGARVDILVRGADPNEHDKTEHWYWVLATVTEIKDASFRVHARFPWQTSGGDKINDWFLTAGDRVAPAYTYSNDTDFNSHAHMTRRQSLTAHADGFASSSSSSSSSSASAPRVPFALASSNRLTSPSPPPSSTTTPPPRAPTSESSPLSALLTPSILSSHSSSSSASSRPSEAVSHNSSSLVPSPLFTSSLLTTIDPLAPFATQRSTSTLSSASESSDEKRARPVSSVSPPSDFHAAFSLSWPPPLPPLLPPSFPAIDGRAFPSDRLRRGGSRRPPYDEGDDDDDPDGGDENDGDEGWTPPVRAASSLSALTAPTDSSTDYDERELESSTSMRDEHDGRSESKMERAPARLR